MYSMTGYGRATIERDGRQLTIEVKSVNHRFLDLNFRMPRCFSFLEEDMRKLISGKLSRGHVDLFATYRNLREDAKRISIDSAALTAYMKALDDVAAAYSLADDRTLMSVTGLQDVLVVAEAEEDSDALKALVHDTLCGALESLTAMRLREGEALQRDVSAYIDNIEKIAESIEARYPQTVEEYTHRLRARIAELIEGGMDEQRLTQEVAIMADRSAIAEETVRLKSHITQLRELMLERAPVGRKLDFLVQELNREVNTISSKSQDIPITRLAVGAKAEIEKLREQVQNIE